MQWLGRAACRGLPLSLLALAAVGVAAGAARTGASPQEDSGIPEGYRLIYDQRFDSEGSLRDFSFSDPDAWTRGEDDRGAHLELLGSSRYRPPHRSPLNIALLRDLAFGDFVLEVEALNTGREYGHRDLCLFFGFESPERYYYAHLATAPDDRAHNIFLVDRAARARTAEVAERGVDWGEGSYHSLRLERLIADGSVRVFFDGELVLAASDGTLGWGRVGLGSFDDRGRFRNLRIWAPEARPVEDPDPFPPPGAP